MKRAHFFFSPHNFKKPTTTKILHFAALRSTENILFSPLILCQYNITHFTSLKIHFPFLSVSAQIPAVQVLALPGRAGKLFLFYSFFFPFYFFHKIRAFALKRSPVIPTSRFYLAGLDYFLANLKRNANKPITLLQTGAFVHLSEG